VTASQRRDEIIRILAADSHVTAGQLAKKFGVTTRTIRDDITALSPDYPLETIRGHGGGVKLMDGFHLHNVIFSRDQETLLLQLMDKADEPQRKGLLELLTAYGSPLMWKEVEDKIKHLPRC